MLDMDEMFNLQERINVAVDESMKFWESAFKAAGFEVEDMWELTNSYWPRSQFELILTNPWWLVKTKYGMIRVGPRKRVFVIDWEDTKVRIPDLHGDDVTKGELYTHAWSKEEALMYLCSLKRKLDEHTK